MLGVPKERFAFVVWCHQDLRNVKEVLGSLVFLTAGISVEINQS